MTTKKGDPEFTILIQNSRYNIFLSMDYRYKRKAQGIAPWASVFLLYGLVSTGSRLPTAQAVGSPHLWRYHSAPEFDPATSRAVRRYIRGRHRSAYPTASALHH